MPKPKSKTPAKSQNVYFGVRLDRDVIERLRERAKTNDRTVGSELARILRTALDQPEGKG